MDWFRNVIACLGDKCDIHLACKDGDPIAGILTMQHRDTMLVKYSCSDPSQRNLGGTQLVFWKAIESAKNSGVLEVDFGRTDCNNPGLATFKERWGAQRSDLVYMSYPGCQSATRASSWKMNAAKAISAHMPDSVLRIAGRVLYKHMG
jgi:lipid II:glycine glycyltransferase (peptidoglycan interpeptide bridge formation enzyme)